MFFYKTRSAWTDGGVYNAVSVVTDKTLTVADTPADAKATGDGLYELKTQINNYLEVKKYKNKFVPDGIKQGYIYAGGTINTTLTSKYTDYYIDVHDAHGKYLVASYLNESDNKRYAWNNILSYNVFDENKQYVSGQDTLNTKSVYIPDNAYYIKLTLHRTALEINELMLSIQDNDTIISSKENYQPGYFDTSFVANGEYNLYAFYGDTSWDKLKCALSVLEYGVIDCPTEINIDSNPFLPRSDKDYRRITIRGGTFVLNSQTIISKTFNYEYCYVPKFSICNFYGSGAVFKNNSNYEGKHGFIGAYFNGCFFYDTSIQKDDSAYIQSLRLIACEIQTQNDFCLAWKLWDCVISGNRFEGGTGTLLKINKNTQDGSSIYDGYHIIVDNNVIEGRTTQMFNFLGRCTDIHINKNYFEGNYAPYFDISSECVRLDITENYFNEWNGSYEYLIGITVNPTSGNLAGNILVQPSTTNIKIFNTDT
jgi:hypothetical protein